MITIYSFGQKWQPVAGPLPVAWQRSGPDRPGRPARKRRVTLSRSRRASSCELNNGRDGGHDRRLHRNGCKTDSISRPPKVPPSQGWLHGRVTCRRGCARRSHPRLAGSRPTRASRFAIGELENLPRTAYSPWRGRSEASGPRGRRGSSPADRDATRSRWPLGDILTAPVAAQRERDLCPDLTGYCTDDWR